MKQAPNAPIWVKVLVLAHAFLIVSWSMPRSAPAVQRGTAQPKGSDWLLYWNDRFIKGMDQGPYKGFAPIKNYVYFTGLWQSWDMFAPNPSNLDVWCDADVEFSDGSVTKYQYPRIYDMPLHMKFLKERYRKYFERVNPDTATWLWPTVGQYMALEEYKSGRPVPVKVRLWRHFIVAQKPQTIGDYFASLQGSFRENTFRWSDLVPPMPPLPKEYTHVMFYEHRVDVAALKKARPEVIPSSSEGAAKPISSPKETQTSK